MEQLNILRHAIDTLELLQVPYLVVGSFAATFVQTTVNATRFTIEEPP